MFLNIPLNIPSLDKLFLTSIIAIIFYFLTPYIAFLDLQHYGVIDKDCTFLDFFDEFYPNDKFKKKVYLYLYKKFFE